MKEKISRNKISRHYKSFFGLENMALAENDHLMIDWGESLINELVNQEVERRIAERMPSKIKTGVCYYFIERLSDSAWLTGSFGWTHEPTEAWMTTERDAMENIVARMFYGRCVVTEHMFDPEPVLRSRLTNPGVNDSQKTEGGIE